MACVVTAGSRCEDEGRTEEKQAKDYPHCGLVRVFEAMLRMGANRVVREVEIEDNKLDV